MQRKYHMMHVGASIFRIFGWIILIVGVISSIIAGALTGGGMGVLSAIAGIIYSVIAGVFILAAADFFYCVMDIEENTRRRE